jgi:hypothetical protein
MDEYFNFLSIREGASDSDVAALMEAFGLSQDLAAAIYRSWLDSLL